MPSLLSMNQHSLAGRDATDCPFYDGSDSTGTEHAASWLAGTNATLLVYYRTYMPPRHLLSLPNGTAKHTPSWHTRTHARAWNSTILTTQQHGMDYK